MATRRAAAQTQQNSQQQNGHGGGGGGGVTGVLSDDLVNFEKGRIKQLQDERLSIQKKTFTKWCNSFLTKARLEVGDLFTDLADGRRLLKLLEIISGEKLGKPNNGKMRVHHVENVNKSLAFLHTKVRLESIGAEDIVDGNPRLILGLIWTIILRFQIQEIEIDVDEDNAASSEKKSAKDALLLWCQRKTVGYPGVNIVDFTGSWRSGLGFNALIHAHRPDLLNYSLLVPSKHIDNLNNAFDIAESGLGIPRLLDAEDIDCTKPDEKSVLTYVASYYHTFARMKNELKGGRRIANILSQLHTIDSLQKNYETLSSNLLSWITSTTTKFNATDPSPSLPLIQKQLVSFKEYRTVEKPPKYTEKSELEATYFNILIKLKDLKRSNYTPADESLMIHGIERAWIGLEKAENRLERRLKEEFERQSKLEEVVLKFKKKADLREGYLQDMIGVLEDRRYGIISSGAMVEATVKKHEAISADILARSERLTQLKQMAEYLQSENYHSIEAILKKSNQIEATWNRLMTLLEKHSKNLAKTQKVNDKKREIESVLEEIKGFYPIDKQKQASGGLVECEEILGRVSLDIDNCKGILGGRVAKLVVVDDGEKELDGIKKELGDKYGALLKDLEAYKSKLEGKVEEYRLAQDIEEEEKWIEEKGKELALLGRGTATLPSLLRASQKLATTLEEIKHREAQKKSTLYSKLPPAKKASLLKKIDALLTTCKEKGELLKQKEALLHFTQDCNEIETWVNEKRPLVESQDYGDDVETASALYRRCKDLMGEIKSFEGDVAELVEKRDVLREEEDADEEAGGMEEEEIQVYQEQVLVPQDYYEEQVVEKTEYKTITEERAVPQVKALYAFKGSGGDGSQSGDSIEMVKGEVLFLLSKTNNDWWNVRKSNGQDGFVPANYVKEIDPKVVLVQVRKPEVIKETVRVKKTKMVMEHVEKKRVAPAAADRPKTQKRKGKGKVGVREKVQAVVDGYKGICAMGEHRLQALLSSIKYHTFLSECDDFTKWLTAKQTQLMSPTDPSEPISVSKKKFDTLFTDLSACTKRLSSIDSMAEELSSLNDPTVRKRQKQVHKLYDELNRLKQEKEKSLEGASSVELFYRQVAEVQEWIEEKKGQIEGSFVVVDRTVEALERRHANLMRELGPIKERVGVVESLGHSVCSTHPREKPHVSKALANLNALYSSLLDTASNRRLLLEQAVGKEIFLNSYKLLKTFADEKRAKLEEPILLRHIPYCEERLKLNEQLGEEIANKKEEFGKVKELGAKLGYEEKVEELDKIERDLITLQSAKQSELLQLLDLLLFEKESDTIDRQIGPFPCKKPDNLEETLSQLKNLGQYEAKLLQLEPSLRLYEQNCLKLEKILSSPSKEDVQRRKEKSLGKRKKLKDKAKENKSALEALKDLYNFTIELQDMNDWILDKSESLSQYDCKDLAKLHEKLLKHSVLKSELAANESKLKELNQKAEQFSDDPAVAKLLKDLNSNWAKLSDICEEKYTDLKMAEQQRNYNKDAEDLFLKLREIEDVLGKDIGDLEGKDRRSCKELLKKHEGVESDLANCEKKLAELVAVAEELKRQGHFDSASMDKLAQQLRDKIDSLKSPLAKKRNALEMLLKFYEYLYEIENQLDYIKEKRSIMNAMTRPQDLHEALLKTKKHSKFIHELENHEASVQKTIDNADKIKPHPEQVKIDRAVAELKREWASLLEAAGEKKKALDLDLKTHQYYSDALEVEQWALEKLELLQSRDFGNDKELTVKLLTKHKSLQLEMDTFSSIVKEMRFSIVKNEGHYEDMVKKQTELEELLEDLVVKSGKRRDRLVKQLNKHEFFAESGEFLQWIEEKILFFSIEEYGVDWEHLEVLRARFEEGKLRVKGAEKRLDALESVVERIGDNADEDEAEKLEWVQRVGSTVSEMHELLCSRWNTLLQIMQAREVKLTAAGEIHRFNRDVAEALERISEKMSQVPDAEVKDLNACETLLRQMESFESDLVPLEVQLQVLVDDSTSLSKKYPTNAQNIQQEQQFLVQNWTALQDRTLSQKAYYQTKLDLFKFLSLYLNLQNYHTQVLKQLLHRDKVTDAQLQLTNHETLVAEINAISDSKYKNAFALAEVIEEKEKSEELKRNQQELILESKKKRVFLDQLIDLQIFLRECKSLEALLNQQEALLKQNEAIETVEQAENALKKHSDLETLLNKQAPKYSKQNSLKLVQQNHFDSPLVEATMAAIVAKREAVMTLCGQKSKRLKDLLAFLKFKRDAEECLVYMEEKQRQLDALKNANVLNLEDKIKKLKRHQKLEMELRAANVQGVITTAQTLSPTELHPLLQQKYSALLQTSSQIALSLSEAQDILDYQNAAEKLEEWMREREALVQTQDLGKDFEHCEELLKRLDLEKFDDSQITELNNLASRINTDCSRINQRWEDLKHGLVAYRQKLESMLETHRFNKEVDELDSRIKDKIPLVRVEDVGKDLDSAILLKKRQDEVDNGMRMIQKKLGELFAMKETLSNVTTDKVENNWKTLSDLAEKRRTALADSLSYQSFLKRTKDFETFVEENVAKLEESSRLAAPKTFEEATSLTDEHKALADELRAKLANSTLVQEMEEHKSPSYHEELTNCISITKENAATLDAALKKKETLLKLSIKLQHFYKLVREAEAGLQELECSLDNFLGDSLELLQKMQKIHGDSESFLRKCEENVAKTEAYGQHELLSSSEAYSKEITKVLAELRHKMKGLKERYDAKTRHLRDEIEVKEFLLEWDKLWTWIHDKLLVAQDDNYSDMTNLQSKTQKHLVFAAEVGGFETKIEAFCAKLGDYRENVHFPKIKVKGQELQGAYEDLKTVTNQKRDRLYEAYQAMLFYNNLEDLDAFLDEPNFEEAPENLSNCKYLIKKWTLIKENHSSKNIDQIKRSLENFKEAKHFLLEEIQSKVEVLLKKYDSFGVRTQDKLSDLQRALRAYEYQSSVDELRDLLQEKQNQLGHIDHSSSSSLNEVEKKIKKVESIDSDLDSFKNSILALNNVGLSGEFNLIKEEIKSKLVLLRQSFSSQRFLSDLNEAKFYIKEKSVFFSSSDVGSDEESVEKLYKKFESHYLNLQQFGSQWEKLTKAFAETKDNHDFEPLVAPAFEKVKAEYSELQKVGDTRKQRLGDSGRLQKYLRECSELVEWIEEQMGKAGSEDYGRDVEHVEILIQKFEAFLSSAVSSGEHRLYAQEEAAKGLVELRHPDEARITSRLTEVKAVWEEFKELASARQEALEGAKRVHMYDRTADELTSWIHQKTLEEDFYETDALASEVEAVKKTAAELSTLFPDAEEHISHIIANLLATYALFLTKLSQHREQAAALANIQSYLKTHEDLYGFIITTQNRLDSIPVSPSVEGAEKQLAKFYEIRKDFEAKNPSFTAFQARSSSGSHNEAVQSEVERKYVLYKEAKDRVEASFAEKEKTLTQNVDLQHFYRDLNAFDGLVRQKQQTQSGLKEEEDIASIQEAEEALRKIEDMELFVALVEGKVGGVERITQVEKEEAARKAKDDEEERRRKQEMVKAREMEKILKEKEKVNQQQSLLSSQVRRGSAPNTMVNLHDQSSSGGEGKKKEDEDLPRSSSFKSGILGSLTAGGEKKPKRTPSFTTRRRTQSFRKQQSSSQPSEPLPPIQMEGYLERKALCSAHQRRATNRSWKTFYTVLCGQLMCFFRERDEWEGQRPASSPPLNIYKSVAEPWPHHHKLHTFRLRLFDGAEFLFCTESGERMGEWITMLNSVSELEPQNQLEPLMKHSSSPSPGTQEGDGDCSSSEDESSRHLSSITKLQNKPRSREPLYANVNVGVGGINNGGGASASSSNNDLFLDTSSSGLRQKPPIPPRSSSITRQLTDEGLESPTSPTGSGGQASFLHPRSSASLPVSVSGTSQQQQQQHVVDSSSESDSPNPKQGSKQQQQQKRNSGLMGLFKRKKATQL